MSYDYEQLMAWHDELSGGRLPPSGLTSLSVDAEAGVLELVLRPEHDEVALQRLLQRVPPDAVRVVISNASWHGYSPTTSPETE